ncbi:Aristolochene synthase in complex with 12,13-Difluorofarnesyl diphosphate [Hypoxylon trugodes]|uniref:Aristolochene synthase in complex with 12,13-Difluorofarnesyl diphosphate n=1 Tax=Hypoxylon trugodes TaxID=326681 RepID=UPI002190CD1D|nr:Aristolochene synthase in complex with 12,13-Difluorofarnesyl diphosphate [Hypoxylon trugodes]KAI1389502.1 Aristolochene synthase in complex with 12,13-Difluorofarnesyl diphosphate [Hypoxylon trugodes]
MSSMPHLEQKMTAGVSESPWVALSHPLSDKVSREVDEYFLEHWNFPDENARQKFVAAGFSRIVCLYFPKALDDRLHFACRLLTLLFLVDDILEYMSLEDGKAYNEKLIPLSRGDTQPDRTIPLEYITYDIWHSMRAHDEVMANDVLEPAFAFMRAQTDERRLESMTLGSYLEYREGDVGKALLSALMRFSMSLVVPPEDLALVTQIERNCSKHITIINDIWSYEKEVVAAKNSHKEGGVMCSGVAVLAQEARITADAAQRVLYHLAREWELSHNVLGDELLAQRDTQELREYVKGLEYQMSGNEMWSKTTGRYSVH